MLCYYFREMIKLTHYYASYTELLFYVLLCCAVLACGDNCMNCDKNGPNRCDPTKCVESGLKTGVVYSNSTQTCVREYNQ